MTNILCDMDIPNANKPGQTKTSLSRALRRVSNKANNNFIKGSSISQRDRELLTMSGFLHEIQKGWHILINPENFNGDPYSLKVRLYDFSKIYLNSRFGEDGWCFHLDNSIPIHLDHKNIPESFVSTVSKNVNQTTDILDVPLTVYNGDVKHIKKDGFNIMSKIDCLAKMPSTTQAPEVENLYLELISTSSFDDLIEVAKTLMTKSRQLLKGFLRRLKSSGKTEAYNWIVASVNNTELPLIEDVNIDVRIERIRGWYSRLSQQIVELNPELPEGPKEVESYIGLMDDVYTY